MDVITRNTFLCYTVMPKTFPQFNRMAFHINLKIPYLRQYVVLLLHKLCNNRKELEYAKGYYTYIFREIYYQMYYVIT